MVKTRLQLLEELYDGAHVQSIQEEFLIEGIQMKIITLIKPDEEQMRKKLEGKLAEVTNTHNTVLNGMKKIMVKIEQEMKKNGLVEIKKVVFTQNDTLPVESKQ